MQTPDHPPLISNALLIELSNPNADQQRGEYTRETRALLAAALPEICAELLTRRNAQARSRSASDLLAKRSSLITARLRAANRAVAAPGAIDPSALRNACETIIRHSDNWQARVAAADTLFEMRIALPGTATQGAA